MLSREFIINHHSVYLRNSDNPEEATSYASSGIAVAVELASTDYLLVEGRAAVQVYAAGRTINVSHDRTEFTVQQLVGGGGGGSAGTVSTGASITGDGSSGDPLEVANPFTDADETKLDGIAAGAQVNAPTNLSITGIDATTATLNSSTGSGPGASVEFPPVSTTHAGFMGAAEKTKLDGIESGATADQSNSEIKAAYEANTNTNAFTDTEKTKLGGIAPGAQVNVKPDWNAAAGNAA